MASSLLTYHVYYDILDHNQINPPQDFSFKLLVKITSGHIVLHPMIFDFSKDEMLFEDDDAPCKQGLLNLLKDFVINTEDVESVLFDLFHKSVDARECVGSGFKGVVLLVLNMNVSTAEESQSDEVIEEMIQELLSETRFKPAARASMRALKTVEFEKQSAAGTSSCVICLEDFIDGLELIEMPCGHDFHGDCIVEWLNTSHQCPLCRFSLPCEEE